MFQRIGPYQVEGEIGRGGMGVVYRATDPRLGRAVAIKTLPAELATDAGRLARFETEARTLASLNHPNVAGIHGLEEQDGQRFLVLELVEGDTLAELLSRGRLPLDQTLAIAQHMASGLQAAHEAGIVHRDLKPANVKVTPRDEVKVLDFGLAKGVHGGASLETSGDSPTMSAVAGHSPTLPGMIMGTAGYMSPEQARGKPVDKRSDIFAFGCVLYEMLTGNGPFGGETVTDSLGAVLHREPDWSSLPDGLPPRLRLLLERCLSKNADRRLHDIADARIEIEDLRAGRGEQETVSPTQVLKPRPWLAVIAFVAGVALTAVAMALLLRPEPPSSEIRRFELSGMGMPIDAFQGLALSPDGSKLVIRARDENGEEHLQLRSFDTFELQQVADSQNGWLPFFSPDGQKVGFFTGGEIRVVGLQAGIGRDLIESDGFSGAVWMEDDSIVWSGLDNEVLFRIPAGGGALETIELEGVASGMILISPSWLPGERALLCGVRRDGRFDAAVCDLENAKLHIIAENAYTPTWAASGHVVFQQGTDGPLMALPFDPGRLTATGPAFPVLDDIGSRVSFQVRMFTIGRDGTLAFIPTAQQPDHATLVWLEQDGSETPITSVDRVADTPRISHDGSRIAFRTPAPNCDIWVHDVERGTTTRVTRERDNHGIAWWPDDRWLAFAREQPDASWGVYGASADGAGAAMPLTDTTLSRGWVLSVSPDARHLTMTSHDRGTNGDIKVVSIDDGQVEDLLVSRWDEQAATFSPDGKMIAYCSNESGRREIYVQPFPEMDSRTQVSIDGGYEPVWSRDGKQLFFRKGNSIYVSDVQTAPVFSAKRPSRLVDAGIAVSPAGQPAYDVSPDGKRFAVFRSPVGANQVEVKVVLNWFEEIEAIEASAR
jgi:serine/threonine-protein kinase